LYDVLSIIALELTDSEGQPMRADTHLGQRVGGQTDIGKVTAASLIDEATRWGIRRRAASAVVATETLDRILAVIPRLVGRYSHPERNRMRSSMVISPRL
jgi:serine/threonine-protein kinase HipA